MADQFQIIPYKVRSAGTDVPPEEIQTAINNLAQQTTIALNSVASDPTGPAGGDLGGNYPNPTVTGSHITSGTISGVAVTGSTINSTPIGGTTPSTGAFTTVTATTPVSPSNGGTGQNTLSAHNVLIGEGTSAVGFAAPSVTAGVPLVSNGSAVDPSFSTASVAGGGTGLATLTAFNVLVGNGTGNVALIAPGAAGIPLTSRGAGTNPAFQGITVAGGGTGLVTIPAHAVMIGEGTGNVATAAPSTAGRALISAGAAADPVFGFPTGALINVQIFTATGTYTATTGTNSVIVEIVGGGGAGGGAVATAAAQFAVGSGGGSGAWARGLITSGFSGATVTIGAAGVGVNGAAGGNGGQSSFGAAIVAPGGVGGGVSAATSNGSSTASNAGTGGNTATGASMFNSGGNTSAPGFAIGQIIAATTGASSPYGAGGIATFQTTGGLATGKGAGGGGVGNSASAAAMTGGNGTAGLCLVYEYA